MFCKASNGLCMLRWSSNKYKYFYYLSLVIIELLDMTLLYNVM